MNTPRERLFQPFLERTPRVGFAHVRRDMLSLADVRSVPTGVDETKACATFVITSDEPDRVGDVVEPKGLILTSFRRNPIGLFNHDPMKPVGKWEDPDGNCTIVTEAHKALGTLYFSQRDPLGVQVFGLVVEGIIRAVSIGFNPLVEPVVRNVHEYNPNSLNTGFRFPSVDLLECSPTSIPCQPVATLARAVLSRGRIAGESILEPISKSLATLAEPTPVWSNGWSPPVQTKDFGAIVKAKIDTLNKAHAVGVWNRSLGRDFAVEDMASRPSNVVYEWVSRHVGCEVKKLSAVGHGVPSARMGSFLTGLKHALAGHDLKDVRNLLGNGTETPPAYKTIQLNSKKSDDFLVNGMAFYAGPQGKFVLEYEPTYGGLHVTAYAAHANKQVTDDVMRRADEWAKANNFLKGEAFALSGEFLDRTPEDWADVILEEKNKKPLARTLKLLNEKGGQFPNRGIILTGPPGTGKTLSGRIIRNQAKASFIWVSARDFHYSGSFGGVSFGFELAKELAPSVLFFEDVDNWLHETTIDLIKTEMDGISRSSGVLTILTTNFPERLPKALIDRPGRFHDVLQFDLPTPAARKAMLQKWLPGLPEEEVSKAVSRTQGYSGAHVYELAHFAKTLRDHEGKDLPAALREALSKVEEQRELIDQLQLTGSHYRLRKEVGDAMSKKWGKTRSKSDKPRVDKGKCHPCEASKTTIAAIPQEAKDALQDCVSRKIRILAEEHPDWENDRRVAAAFSICGEKSEGEDKAMGESDGAAGGYAVPENDAKDDTEPYGQDEPGAPQHVLSGKSGEAAETKAMPNVPPVPGADPNMPPDPMNPQPQPPAAPAGNPREAISAFMNASSAFVDAAALLFDLVNNTGAQAAVPGAAPGATPPGAMPTELEDDDLDLDLDDDGAEGEVAGAEGEEATPGEESEEESDEEDSGGEDAASEEDEDALKDRYGMGKAGVPAVTKGSKPAMSHRKTLRAAARHFKAIAEHEGELTDMHKAACMGYHHAIKAMCKGMGEEMPADGMGDGDGDDDDEAPAESRDPAERPEEPATEKSADALDLSAILKGIAPLNAQLDALDSRASALGEKWLNLNGAMN